MEPTFDLVIVGAGTFGCTLMAAIISLNSAGFSGLYAAKVFLELNPDVNLKIFDSVRRAQLPSQCV
jgi:hypothetical protein